MTANGCGVHGRWKKGCPGCQRIARTYEQRRRRAKQEGTWKPQVPAEHVQAHIDSLLSAGANLGGIAVEAGLSHSTVYGIRKRVWVQGETAAAILAVREPAFRLKGGLVSPLGVERRIQSLLALGWSFTEQGRRLGMSVQQVWQLARGKSPLVSTATDTAVRALFEQLSGTPGSSVRARNQAVREGWLPPLAWDDIDDPSAEPSVGDVGGDAVDEVAVERALDGCRVELTDAELIAALRMGTARGVALSALAARLGLNAFGARKLLGGELTPRREKAARVEAELRRVGDRQDDFTIAAGLGVHPSTVARARKRLSTDRGAA